MSKPPVHLLAALLNKYKTVDLNRVNLVGSVAYGIDEATAKLAMKRVAEGQTITGGSRILINIGDLGGEIQLVGIKGLIIHKELISLPRTLVYTCPSCTLKYKNDYSIYTAIHLTIKKHDITTHRCPACGSTSYLVVSDPNNRFETFVHAVITDGTGTIDLYAPKQFFESLTGDVAVTGIYFPKPLGYFIYVTGVEHDVQPVNVNPLELISRAIHADTISVAALLSTVIRPSDGENIKALVYVANEAYRFWTDVEKMFIRAGSVKIKLADIAKYQLHRITPLITTAYGKYKERETIKELFHTGVYHGGRYVKLANNLIVVVYSRRAFDLMRKLPWDLTAVLTKDVYIDKSKTSDIANVLLATNIKKWKSDVPQCITLTCKSLHKLIGQRYEVSTVLL